MYTIVHTKLCVQNNNSEILTLQNYKPSVAFLQCIDNGHNRKILDNANKPCFFLLSAEDVNLIAYKKMLISSGEMSIGGFTLSLRDILLELLLRFFESFSKLWNVGGSLRS